MSHDKKQVDPVRDPGLCEGRVKRFIPTFASLYEALKAHGDVSGVDKALRLAEEEHAALDVINAGQLRLREERETARKVLEDAGAARDGMVKALRELRGIHPPPEGLAEILVEVDLLARGCEKTLLQAERKHVQLDDAFRAGAKRLEAAGQATQTAVTDALGALVAVAATRAAGLGQEDREVIESDSFLTRYPGRCPDCVLEHYEEVAGLEEFGESMGKLGKVFGAYRAALGEHFEVVQAKAVSGRSLPRESGMRSPEPSPEPMMREVF